MTKIVKHDPDDQPPLKPDGNAMLRFIKKLHGDNPAWYLAYSNKAEKQSERTADSFSSKPSNDLKARLVKANSNGMNVAVAVNTITGSSCTVTVRESPSCADERSSLIRLITRS